MADGCRRENRPAPGGKAAPAVRPRVCGTLPWDVESRARQASSGPAPPPPPRPAPPTHAAPVCGDDPGRRRGSCDREQELINEENALLEELDEVLSSTTGSKSSKSTNESRVTNDSSAVEAALLEEEQNALAEEVLGYEANVLAEKITDEENILLEAGLDEPEIAEDNKEPVEPDKSQTRAGMWCGTDAPYRPLSPEEKQLDLRLPRYNAQFANYEDMLEHLDAADPFGGPQPPPGAKPPVMSTALNGRMTEPRPRRARPEAEAKESRRQKRLRKAKSEEVLASNPKSEKTSTEKPTLEEKEAEPKESLRRVSVDSAKTYIVGRTDSRAALVGSPKVEQPPLAQSTREGMIEERDERPLPRGSISSVVAAVEFTRQIALRAHRTEAYEDIIGRRKGLDEYNTRDFIKKHFKHRQCDKFIPNPRDETKCGCGRDKRTHTVINVPVEVAPEAGAKWKSKLHTRQIEPNTFGSVIFHGFGHETTKARPYLRLDANSCSPAEQLQNVWELLDNYWDMEPPKMIVSVTGGAKRFFMKPRLKNSFQRGLINVATSSGAWIITGGTGTGVMQFVGEAVREHTLTSGGVSGQQVVALGIATWGTIDNKQALISHGMGNFPAYYSIEHLTNKKRTAPLDPNHTHFLLLDDGTHGQFGKEILFRAELESFISNHLVTGVSKTQRVHVPVVLLVLEGGVNTLETVFRALEQKTPVVIIQGSGRAADFIATAYKEIRGGDDESKLQLDDDVQRIRAGNMFEWKSESEKEVGTKKCCDLLRSILEPKYRSNVTVFTIDDVDTTKEIDEAILFALLKAKRSEAQQQLNLALAWNRCDVARKQIFDIENRGNWQTMDLNRSMLTALLQDRPDFVQLFMDNGVDLSKFLTKNILRMLYAEVVNNKTAGVAANLLLNILKESQHKFGLLELNKDGRNIVSLTCLRREPWQKNLPNLLRLVGRVINILLGEHNENIYKDPKYIIPVSEQGQDGEWMRGESRRGSQYSVIDEKSPKAQSVVSQVQASLVAEQFVSPDQPLAADILRNKRSRWRQKHAEQDPDIEFEHPERDLFTWAVLLNRQDLARIFWRAGQDHIGGALMASSLLKSLGDRANTEEEIDLAQDFYKNAEEWEVIAVGVLNECYQRDKELSHELLTRELSTWGHTTLFVMADSADQMDFMGHSCCQTKLNRIWRGKMALYTPMMKIILCMFLPIFLPLIRFSTSEFSRLFRPPDKENDAQSSDVRSLRQGSHNQIEPVDRSVPDEEEVEFVRANTRRPRRSMYKHRADSFSLRDGCSGHKLMTLLGVILYYYQAPVTKFCFHTLSYLCFLGLFSFFLLTDLQPLSVKSPSVHEYIVWGWAASLFIEEIRQISTQYSKTLSSKLSSYFNSIWNIFDIAIHILFIISIILRHVLDAQFFVWARIFYSLTLGMYFLRFMQIFYINKNIGPKVIMIRRMLTDLLFFVAILLTVMLAYGVAVHALRFPNSEPNIVLLKDVLYKPYWQIYGELFLDDLEGNVENCSRDENVWKNATSGMTRCPEKNGLVVILFAAYMIMTNILLLNLLIAMFSYTFERVQENSEKVWRFYRYSLTYEYFDKPTIAPPFILLNHIFRVVKYICRQCPCTKDDKFQTDFRKKLSETENQMLTAFERSGMEKYLLGRIKTAREHIDTKVSSASDRIERVIEDLEQIKEQVTGHPSSEDPEMAATLKSLTASQPEPRAGAAMTPRDALDEKLISGLQERVAGLEEKLSDQTQAFEEMVTLMKNMSTAFEEGSRRQPENDVSEASHVSSVTSMTAPVVSGERRPIPYRRLTYTKDPHIEISDIPTPDPTN